MEPQRDGGGGRRCWWVVWGGGGDLAKLFLRSRHYFSFFRQFASESVTGSKKKLEVYALPVGFYWVVFLYIGLTYNYIKSVLGSTHSFNIRKRHLKKLFSMRGLSHCKEYSKWQLPHLPSLQIILLFVYISLNILDQLRLSYVLSGCFLGVVETQVETKNKLFFFSKSLGCL